MNKILKIIASGKMVHIFLNRFTGYRLTRLMNKEKKISA